MVSEDRNKSHFFEYGDRMLISVPQYLTPGRKVYAMLDEDFCAAFPGDRVCECTVTEVGSRGFWVSSFVPPQDDMGDFFAWEKVGSDVFLSREDAMKHLD